MTEFNAATMTPILRFRKVDGRVQLNHGDVTFLARELGLSQSHVNRVLLGERKGPTVDAIEALVGVPLSHIDTPRKRAATEAAAA